MGLLTGIKKGRGRVKLLQYHRLYEFERTFTAYLEGQATAAEVKRRADLMLKIGLPHEIK
jgi:hypothetical protein